MPRKTIYDMSLETIYNALLQKLLKKGHTQQELDTIIHWLTGYDMHKVDMQIRYADFINNSPIINPKANQIKGTICGVRVETIEDPCMQKIRWLDKLVDDLAKGKSLDKILL
ncbi:MAG: DUF2200 domain-containing protein [Erysipelotrichaceae bacterium]|nr:DUF2200 domain-containing protein [Erysipelotrichaceae bacterium]